MGQTYRNDKKKRISSSFYFINKVKGVLSRKHLTSLYYALVYPHLLYGITMWGNTYQVYLTKLMTTQKKIVRCIAGAYFNAHTDPLFKSLKLLKLPDMQVAKYVRCCITKELPVAHPHHNIITKLQHKTKYILQITDTINTYFCFHTKYC